MSKRVVQHLAADGEIPQDAIGHRVLSKQEDLDDYVKRFDLLR